MAIALNHLRRDRRRFVAVAAAGIGLDLRRQMRKCADRTRQLADGDDLARPAHARHVARQLRIPQRELQSEGHRFGVHAVRAADHRCTSMLLGPRVDRLHQAVEAPQDQITGLAHLQCLRCIDDVR